MKKKPAITVIEPSRGVIGFSLKDISKHWELLYFLVWRNIKVRYKQTVIGVVWVVIQPVAAAVIFAIIFGKFVNLPSEGQPYVVFVFCAFLPWNLFANSILKASNSLVLNRNLITKIYFPRIFIPMAIVMENLVDFFIACLIFFILIIFYKGAPVLNLPAFLYFSFLTITLAMGLGFWLSALNVKYRDVHQAIPFLIQIWFYASPVAYTSTVIPKKWLFLYSLNPMVGIIDGFRWTFFGGSCNSCKMFIVSPVIVIIIFLIGIFYFSKTEKKFVDII